MAIPIGMNFFPFKSNFLHYSSYEKDETYYRIFVFSQFLISILPTKIKILFVELPSSKFVKSRKQISRTKCYINCQNLFLSNFINEFYIFREGKYFILVFQQWSYFDSRPLGQFNEKQTRKIAIQIKSFKLLVNLIFTLDFYSHMYESF